MAFREWLTVAEVNLREITEDNVRSVMDLEVAPHQAGFVATNARSIAEAAYTDEKWLRAIYLGDEPIGLVLLSERHETPRYYLWRFMIDHRHQGKGYGRAAMDLTIEYVRTLPNASELFLSYVPGDAGPERFYKLFGFEDTGREPDGELEARLEL